MLERYNLLRHCKSVTVLWLTILGFLPTHCNALSRNVHQYLLGMAFIPGSYMELQDQIIHVDCGLDSTVILRYPTYFKSDSIK
jgi:hypothetical protein